jgi:transcription-repair coupling factor (superfamily II helicase)
MYTGMLEEAVREMKGEHHEERPAVQMNLGISLRLDDSYITEENQRLRLYKKVAAAKSSENIDEIRAELADRYGPLPEPTQHLLQAAQLRVECERIGVAQIDRKRDKIHLRFTEKASVDPERLMAMVARNAKRGAQFTPQGVLKLPLRATAPMEIFAELEALLVALAIEPAMQTS